MFSISAKQHSRILGFALIAYGFQYFFGALRATDFILRMLFGSGEESRSVRYLLLPFESRFYPLWIFVVSVVLGIAILLAKRWVKFFSLFFVVLTLADFPLGTILSFYTLFYLFAITENKTDIEPNLSEDSK